MARKRLTRRLAVDDETPFPGDVGNPNRTDPKSDDYDPYQQVVNYELPDNRTEWRSETRNEIGFGVPTYANIRQAASKAVKLAMLLLGEKVAEEIVEAQAKDFMRLGSEALDNSLVRFTETEKLYADDDEEEEKEEAKKGDDDEDEKEEAKKGDDDEDEKEEAKTKSSAAELGIEMTSIDDDEEDEEDSETASLLASLFAEEEAPEDEGESKEEAPEKKSGISKLGGQPKVAADMSSDDISNLWEDAPDVSQAFGQ